MPIYKKKTFSFPGYTKFFKAIQPHCESTIRFRKCLSILTKPLKLRFEGRRINIGRFEFRIYTNCIKIFPVDLSPFDEFPHVNEFGSVCWGDGSWIPKKIRNYQYIDAFDGLINFVKCTDGENRRFFDGRIQRVRRGIRVRKNKKWILGKSYRDE